MPTIRYTLDEVLPPDAKETFRHLELYARRAVSGKLHGMHISKRRGVSTEFDHHKQYQPGDPIKHMDWKATARHDRYFIKRYIEDSALTVHTVVDHSASMAFSGGELPSKYLQAARLAACVAYMLSRQSDASGLILADQNATQWVPAGSTAAHLVRMLTALAMGKPSHADGLAEALRALAERPVTRGVVIIATDLMFEPDAIQQLIGRIQAQGHEVVLAQIADPAESQFPFNRWIHFRDLENTASRRRVDTLTLKRIYVEEYQKLMDNWRRWTRRRDVHWIRATTDSPVEAALADYLAARSGVADA